jgi:peptidoglycan biosynthesis protein MviN/MurJ (putative lipid II flippase)
MRISKMAHAVGIATVGNLIGRAANVLIPFTVVALYGADSHTDRFFFIYALAFFFFGTISNAIADASIPLILSGRLVLSRIRIFLVGLVSALLVLSIVGICHITFTDISIGYAIALGVLSGAGLANGLASGHLFSQECFGTPGITWVIRFLPLAAFILADWPEACLAWFAVAIGLADWLRLAVMLKTASFRVDNGAPGLWQTTVSIIPAYGLVITAAAIMGLNPVIDRLIAEISGPGAVSILETAERAYGIIATLCTIGMTSVLLTHLSKLSSQVAIYRQWINLLGFLTILCACWMVAGIVFGLWGFSIYFEHFASLSPIQSATIRKTYWYYLAGMPVFVIMLAYIKRLQSQQRWWSMVRIALLSVGLNIPVSLMLRYWMGVPGIALATTAIYIPVLLFLIFSSHHHANRDRQSK